MEIPLECFAQSKMELDVGEESSIAAARLSPNVSPLHGDGGARAHDVGVHAPAGAGVDGQRIALGLVQQSGGAKSERVAALEIAEAGRQRKFAAGLQRRRA